MPSEAPSDVKFEIGHVLFIDIVGYSKLLMHEQSEQLQTLKEIVRATEQFRIAEAEGKLLRLPTGDGGALVFRNNQEAPVLCAIEISRALKNHPELRVRMGIHSGPVNEIADLNEQANIAGAGINIAQRVMDCGDAGHILLSRHVAEDLEHFARWQPYLHDLGECEVKHGRRIPLVNFYSDEIGNPELPSKCQAAAAQTGTQIRFLWRPTIVAAATILILVAIAAILLVSGVVQLGRRTAINSKSIAVLPFENLSHDQENAYFADGIQDEILSRLSKIADLKVISRTSTQKYKSTPANLSDIGKQLGVAHILEGSVQKAADQVRVSVQLIRAETDSHIWAQEYNRQLIDVFAVETEIATKIAAKLELNLTGAEHRAVAARPTEDPEAYQLYLKGRSYWRRRSDADVTAALEYFQQAISHDPNYARAYSGMADCYLVLPFSGKLPASVLAGYTAKAKLAAAKAVELDDDLAEAHNSLATALFYQFNFREARREFVRAIELDPNYVTAHQWYGYRLLTALGESDQAIVEMKRAVELDPRSTIVNANLAYSYIFARRYADAIEQARKTLAIDPDDPLQFFAKDMLALALALNGQVDAAIPLWEESYRVQGDYHTLNLLAWGYATKGDKAKATELFDSLKEMQRHGSAGWDYGSAYVDLALGNKTSAIDWLEKAYREQLDGTYIRVDPLLDALRGDPRFERIANEIIPASVK